MSNDVPDVPQSPLEPSQVQRWLDAAEGAMRTASAPSIVALLLGIVSTQFIKGLAERLMPHRMGENDGGLRPGEVWFLSFAMTVLCFWVACRPALLNVPFAGANAGLGIAAGLLAPLIVALLKWRGIDLDRLPLLGSPSVRAAAKAPPVADPSGPPPEPPAA